MDGEFYPTTQGWGERRVRNFSWKPIRQTQLEDPFIDGTKTLSVSKWNSECGCGPA